MEQLVKLFGEKMQDYFTSSEGLQKPNQGELAFSSPHLLHFLSIIDSPNKLPFAVAAVNYGTVVFDALYDVASMPTTKIFDPN